MSLSRIIHTTTDVMSLSQIIQALQLFLFKLTLFSNLNNSVVLLDICSVDILLNYLYMDFLTNCLHFCSI